jgi:TorA maturation chaperone TorD
MTTEPTGAVPLAFAAGDDTDDELARAELYGLLAELWLAPPAAEQLARFKTAVTQAPQPGAFLEAPWERLVAALRATDVDSARAEYGALFHGVGKAEVFVYGSHYLSGSLNDKPLVALRADLAALGLQRGDERGETEDHVAFVFEVMRWLIAGDDVVVCNLNQQRRFFRNHVQTWVGSLCEATIAHPRAVVWRAVAAFTQAFVEVEAQGFDFIEE